MCCSWLCGYVGVGVDVECVVVFDRVGMTNVVGSVVVIIDDGCVSVRGVGVCCVVWWWYCRVRCY